MIFISLLQLKQHNQNQTVSAPGRPSRTASRLELGLHLGFSCRPKACMQGQPTWSQGGPVMDWWPVRGLSRSPLVPAPCNSLPRKVTEQKFVNIQQFEASCCAHWSTPPDLGLLPCHYEARPSDPPAPPSSSLVPLNSAGAQNIYFGLKIHRLMELWLTASTAEKQRSVWFVHFIETLETLWLFFMMLCFLCSVPLKLDHTLWQ